MAIRRRAGPATRINRADRDPRSADTHQGNRPAMYFRARRRGALRDRYFHRRRPCAAGTPDPTVEDAHHGVHDALAGVDSTRRFWRIQSSDEFPERESDFGDKQARENQRASDPARRATATSRRARRRQNRVRRGAATGRQRIVLPSRGTMLEMSEKFVVGLIQMRSTK